MGFGGGEKMKASELSSDGWEVSTDMHKIDWIIINDCMSWSIEQFEKLPATHPRKKSALKIKLVQFKVQEILKQMAKNESE